MTEAPPKTSVAERIWWFIRDRGARGASADEVLETFPDIGHTTATARIHGLKHAGLIVRHPEKIVRKTRKGRTAEVWVVRRGVKFKRGQEPKGPKPPKPVRDLHWRLTEIVDSAFGPRPTASIDKLLAVLEERAEEMRVERIKEDEAPGCDLLHATPEERGLLDAARAYSEHDFKETPESEAKVETLLEKLFDEIHVAYPMKVTP